MHISTDAITWSLKQLKALPRDQILLLFLLCVELAGRIDYIKEGGKATGFLRELEKFIGVQIDNKTLRIFSPFEGKWRAGAYLQSTVLGRLLNGSHSWTNPTNGFIQREPKRGWPAELTVSQNAIALLEQNSKSPRISHTQLPSIQALAILYFKYETLPGEAKDIFSVVELFKSKFPEGSPVMENVTRSDIMFLGRALVPSKPTLSQVLDCYPPLEFSRITLSEEISRIAAEKAPPEISPTNYVELLVRNAK